MTQEYQVHKGSVCKHQGYGHTASLAPWMSREVPTSPSGVMLSVHGLPVPGLGPGEAFPCKEDENSRVLSTPATVLSCHAQLQPVDLGQGGGHVLDPAFTHHSEHAHDHSAQNARPELGVELRDGAQARYAQELGPTRGVSERI